MATDTDQYRAGGRTRTFRGHTLEEILPRIRAELGPDAVILREREGLAGGVGGFFAQRFIEIEARRGDSGSIDVYDDLPGGDLRIDTQDLEHEPVVSDLRGETRERGRPGERARVDERGPGSGARPGGAGPESETRPGEPRPFVPPVVHREQPTPAPAREPEPEPEQRQGSLQRPAQGVPDDAEPPSAQQKQDLDLRPAQGRRLEASVFMQRLREASARLQEELPPGPVEASAQAVSPAVPEAPTAPAAPEAPVDETDGMSAPRTGARSADRPAHRPPPVSRRRPPRAKPSVAPEGHTAPEQHTAPEPSARTGFDALPGVPALSALTQPGSVLAPPLPLPQVTPQAQLPPPHRPRSVAQGLPSRPRTAPLLPAMPPPTPVPQLAPAPQLAPPPPLAPALANMLTTPISREPAPAAPVFDPLAQGPTRSSHTRATSATRLGGRLIGRLSRLLDGIHSNDPTRPAPARSLDPMAVAAVNAALEARGASSTWSSNLIGVAAAHRAPLSGGGLRAAARAELAHRIVPAPALPAGGAAIAFIGAGGSGKTRCTAALANAYRHRSTLEVTVLALDNRDGALELRRLLHDDRVPVLERSGERARRVIDGARNGGLVVVDAAAVAPTDPKAINSLRAKLRLLQLDALYVTLPATLGPQAARRALASFAALSPTAIAITHADETDQLAVIVEIATAHRIPLAFIHAGTDHRSALRAVDPAMIAERLLR